MARPALRSLLCVLPVVVFSAACSAQWDGGDSYDDLRRMVLEQRRAIADLRREQESVRATLDQMQYGRRPAGRAVYGPTGGPGSADDSTWQRPTPVPAGGDDPRFSSPDASASQATMPGDSPTWPRAATAPASSAAAPAPASEPVAPVPQELVGSAYDSAMRQFSNGDHDEAIQSFRNFLHDHASSPYADDAQYWIGEAYFRKGQYHRAIIELQQVSVNYASGDRAAASLLRQAEAFRIVGDRVDAKLSLQKVTSRYANTPEAAKASRMLAELGG